MRKSRQRQAKALGAATGIRVRGFTLVELMIAVAVLTVLLAVAIPSFSFVSNSSNLSAMANELVASVQIARTEAIRRGVRTVICPSTNGTACVAGSDWSAGWLVYFDDDRDGVLDAGETVLRTVAGKVRVQVQASPAVGAALTFRPDGRARTTAGALLVGMIAVCMPVKSPVENVRNVAISFGSQVSVIRKDGGGACAAPANA